jgi:hypothetical protein
VGRHVKGSSSVVVLHVTSIAKKRHTFDFMIVARHGSEWKMELDVNKAFATHPTLVPSNSTFHLSPHFGITYTHVVRYAPDLHHHITPHYIKLCSSLNTMHGLNSADTPVAVPPSLAL